MIVNAGPRPRARARHRGRRGIPGRKRGHQSTIVIEGLAPVEDPVWSQVTPSEKRRFFQFCRGQAESLMRRQLIQGIGADGQRLIPVAPSTRARGRWRSKSGKGRASAPPLVPAYTESRTLKWLRSSVNHAIGTVSLWWSHGWMEVLGYHAAGEVIGAPIRDVLGLSPSNERRLRDEARRFWLRSRPTPGQLARRRYAQDRPGSPRTRPPAVPLVSPTQAPGTPLRAPGRPGRKAGA